MSVHAANDWILYGATGYTGRLIAKEAVRLGLRPVLAGRSAEAVQALATELGLPWSVFSVDDTDAMHAALTGKKLLLSAAGPFSETAPQIIEACIACKTHYLDVTGDIAVFELAASNHSKAKQAQITLLPGVGFDVVPSDCLAAHTAAHSKNPAHLRLAIKGLDSPSPGTAKSMIEGLGRGTAHRRGGKIVYERAGDDVRSFDFGHGAEEFVRVSWGDIATAYHSTGIGNIDVYFPNQGPIKTMVGIARHTRFLIRQPWLQQFVQRRIEKTVEGPDEQARSTSGATLRAEVTDESGAVFISQLNTPNGYTLTAQVAVEACQEVLTGHIEHGFKTPATAFGPRFIERFEGCKIEDH